MKLKEGIDYHIKDMGKFKELTSVILSGFAAGIVDLTRRGYDLNEDGTQTVGGLMVARTLPKKKSSTKTKTNKKAPAKSKEAKAEKQPEEVDLPIKVEDKDVDAIADLVGGGDSEA